jgi:hypothetical protein
MSHGAIGRMVLVVTLAMLTLGSSLTVSPARTEADPSPSAEQSIQVQAVRYGPFATMRRANEVANHFRGRGYNALAFPEWGAYYVNVW